jgi:hypothetical protein
MNAGFGARFALVLVLVAAPARRAVAFFAPPFLAVAFLAPPFLAAPFLAPPFFAPALFVVAIDQFSGSEGIAFDGENTSPSGHKLRAYDGDAIGGGAFFPLKVERSARRSVGAPV